MVTPRIKVKIDNIILHTAIMYKRVSVSSDLELIFERENTFISSSGVGCDTVVRLLPKAPLTEVIQLRLAYIIRVYIGLI